MSLMLIWGGLIILRSWVTFARSLITGLLELPSKISHSLHRFLQGRWWLFRNQRTSSSSKLYLIPNSTTSFIFVEGLFFLFWIGYTYYSRAIDERQTSGKLRGYIMVPVWSLCWLGAVSQGSSKGISFGSPLTWQTVSLSSLFLSILWSGRVRSVLSTSLQVYYFDLKRKEGDLVWSDWSLRPSLSMSWW